MTTTQRARDLAEKIVVGVCELPDRTSPDDWPEAMLVTGEELHALIMDRAKAALDAAWRDGVEAAANVPPAGTNYVNPVGWNNGYSAGIKAKYEAIRALLPPDPITAPGYTDLMMAPESANQTACAEAYQAVGAMADALGYWQMDANDPDQRAITKLLDNLSAASDGRTPPHADLLPFVLKRKLPDRDAPDAVGALARLFAEDWRIRHELGDPYPDWIQAAVRERLIDRVRLGSKDYTGDYDLTDLGRAALALARRGDGG